MRRDFTKAKEALQMSILKAKEALQKTQKIKTINILKIPNNKLISHCIPSRNIVLSLRASTSIPTNLSQIKIKNSLLYFKLSLFVSHAISNSLF